MVKIAILLTQGFAGWEYALIAGTGGPFYGLNIQFFTPVVGKIQSQGGLEAVLTQDLDEFSTWQPNAVIVVGGTIWETDKAPDISKSLKTQYDNGAVVAGICSGTLALARAGLLDIVRHTSNDAEFIIQNVKDYTGSEFYHVSDAAIYEDRVITAPGTAPVSFTAAVFEGVGIDQEKVQQFRAMMAAEHS